MGGIAVGGGGHGGKKSVDSEIPLVPFIDLLLCCIMFLLATAVWNKIAALDANQQTPGQAQDTPPPDSPQTKLYLQITQSGYRIASTDGAPPTEINKNGDRYDAETLRQRLHDRRQAEPNRRDIIVSPEDGVKYENVIEAMDLALGEGYQQVSFSDAVGI